MQIYELPKRSGGVRRIYAPDDAERELLRSLLPALGRVQLHDAAHGFREGRGVITAAEPHCGMAVTINLDLSSFFDSCTLQMARERRVPAVVLESRLAFLDMFGTSISVCGDGASERDFSARQGLPTSPAIANVCAVPLDEAIIRALRKGGHVVCTSGRPEERHTAAYTRYADDLSISFQLDPGQPVLTGWVDIITAAAKRCGFQVNQKKTRIRRASGGRREIVGVLVDESIHASRRHRRALRAAEFNALRARLPEGPGARNRRLGLGEWVKCKRPLNIEAKRARELARAERAIESVWREADRIALADGLYRINLEWAKSKVWKNETIDAVHHCRITVDPREILRMGNVRYPESNSYSCLRRHGGYYHGVVFWVCLPGAAIAVMDGQGSEYRARVVVYQLRDGRRVFGRMYGNNRADRDRLSMALHLAGVERLEPDEVRGAEVVGYVPRSVPLAYLDFGRAERVRLKSGVESWKLTF